MVSRAAAMASEIGSRETFGEKLLDSTGIGASARIVGRGIGHHLHVNQHAHRRQRIQLRSQISLVDTHGLPDRLTRTQHQPTHDPINQYAGKVFLLGAVHLGIKGIDRLDQTAASDGDVIVADILQRDLGQHRFTSGWPVTIGTACTE